MLCRVSDSFVKIIVFIFTPCEHFQLSIRRSRFDTQTQILQQVQLREYIFKIKLVVNEHLLKM